MFGALKRGRFQSLASLILVVNVVGELQRKRTLAASRGFLAAARLSCIYKILHGLCDISLSITFATRSTRGNTQIVKPSCRCDVRKYFLVAEL